MNIQIPCFSSAVATMDDPTTIVNETIKQSIDLISTKYRSSGLILNFTKLSYKVGTTTFLGCYLLCKNFMNMSY